jgi:predicted  nucleic acid-binding Zn-ribbon protein
VDSSEPTSVCEPDVSREQWQVLEVRWKSILALEAGIDSMRQRLEGTRSQLEAAFRHSLTVDEKVNALQADVAQWNKAKNRAHYTLPKVKEFVHRATWALGLPERKKLDEVFKAAMETQVLPSDIEKLPERLDSLLKDRQVLSAHGTAVDQECRNISAEIQRTLRTLQNNAAARVRDKRDTMRTKGKHL